MVKGSLKTQATKGIIWNTVENLSIQAAQFTINLILARILMPSDFGLIGMLNIFIALSQTFMFSGMGTALIQKRTPTPLDYSTVFVYNLAFGFIIYSILFLSAPFIASFYKMPQLVLITKVLMLNILINSLALVQTSRLTINLDFRTMAKVNIASVIISGVIAIACAYLNFGVWALVIQNLLKAGISVGMFWYISRWKVSLRFSKASFKELFGFGSKLLGASIIATFFDNIYRISIGRFYSATDLGYFAQAKQFTDTTSGTVSTILQKVTFPILALLQDDKQRIVSAYSRILGMISFFIFPVMSLLALLAEPFIRFFLTSKWLPTVPLLQWLCLARVTYPISSLNMNILNAKGRSDLFLRNDLVKIPVLAVSLVVTIPLGIKAVVIGSAFTSVILFFINAYMPGKLFSYGAFSQLRDMADKIIATVLMSVIVYLELRYIKTSFLKLLIGGFTGVISYLLISYIIKVKEVNELKNLQSFIQNLRRGANVKS